MDISNYTTITRQAGLMREMEAIANNIANAATTGFRQEGMMFSEYLVSTMNDSVSMAHANLSRTDFSQGALVQTGNQIDLALQGQGYFAVATQDGQRLTRNGAFSILETGQMVTNDGYSVLDMGGGPLFVPPDVANFTVGGDGTISDGERILGQVGVLQPAENSTLIREDGVLFKVVGETEMAIDTKILQGFLEKSNTDPVQQMARMIAVQRAYEIGQSFQETEDKRVRSVAQAIS